MKVKDLIYMLQEQDPEEAQFNHHEKALRCKCVRPDLQGANHD